jgi:predicted chitinase
MQVSSSRDTLLKTHPLDHHRTDLPEDFRWFHLPETHKPLAVEKAFNDVGGHVKLAFSKPLTIGSDKFPSLYGFRPHLKGVTAIQDAIVETAVPMSTAGSSIYLLETANFVQNNNHDWQDDNSKSNIRYGAVQCGLTTLANAIWPHLTGKERATIIAQSPTGKFDDGIAAIFKSIGAKSTFMEDHVRVLNHLGFGATAYRDKTIADSHDHFERTGQLQIWGTIYGTSGHFVAMNGFDLKTGDTKLVDPNGLRDGCGNSWRKIFRTEADFEPDSWTPDRVNALWSSQYDGWCVLIDPRGKPIALPSPPAASTAIPDTITIVNSTWQKVDTRNSNELNTTQKQRLSPGATIGCKIVGTQAKHVKIKLADRSIWYLYMPDIALPGNLEPAPISVVEEVEYDRFLVRRAVDAVAAPDVTAEAINKVADSVMSECPKFGITTRLRLAHFLGQCSVESAGFEFFHELGDEAYFTRMYENRPELGNANPGDGAKFPGAGWIMITGRNWYQRFSDKINRPDIMENPEVVCDYPLCVAASLFWWDENRMNPECDQGLTEAAINNVGEIVNGGDTHRAERYANTMAIAKVFGLC